jgi:hypothetical protein
LSVADLAVDDWSSPASFLSPSLLLFDDSSISASSASSWPSCDGRVSLLLK